MTGVVAFAKLPLQIDLQGLRRDVDTLLSGDWIDHVNRSNYDGGWDVLPLRCQTEHLDSHPILQSFSIEAGSQWANLPALETASAVKEILDFFEVTATAPLKAVRLMRLKPGAYIRPHNDAGLAMEYGEARFHVPVYASQHVEFVVADQPVPMLDGELWYLNADQQHWVRNNGDRDRINLVIDCAVSASLQKMITRAAGDLTQPYETESTFI